MSTISMADVANLAGVSKATVSRAINSPERLDADTRSRVVAAIKTLGYVPDGVARSLRTQKTRTIGMCVPTLAHALFTVTVERIQEVLSQSGYNLLLAVHDYDPGREAAEYTAMIQRGVDGVILVGGQHDPSLFALLKSKAIPYVIVWSVHADHPSIGFDHRRSMVQVGMTLIGMGHKRIATIMTDHVQNERVRDRLLGVGDALAAHGLDFPPEYQRTTTLGLKSSGEATADLLALPRPPSAIICVNDVMAVGAVLECQKCGVNVPRDISIVGFSASELGQMLSPSITSVDTPVGPMGERAAKFLLDRISGLEITLHEVLPTSMIRGQSVAPPAELVRQTQGNRHAKSIAIPVRRRR